MSLFGKKTKKTDAPVKTKIETAVPEKKSTVHQTVANTVLKQPWLSERATMLLAQNKYVFLVSENATKPSVRDEVQRRYGVKVTAVNMISRAGKLKRYGSRTSRRESIKKAIITLKAGDKIEVE
ncbi:MAG: 50S ribosomal protein L23 [Minisyncoccia bacterium]